VLADAGVVAVGCSDVGSVTGLDVVAVGVEADGVCEFDGVAGVCPGPVPLELGSELDVVVSAPSVSPGSLSAHPAKAGATQASTTKM
jgi:hypothetical protein